MAKDLQHAIMFGNVAFLIAAGILLIPQIFINGFVALILLMIHDCTHGRHPKLKIAAGGCGKSVALVLLLSAVFIGLLSATPGGQSFVIVCR